MRVAGFLSVLIGTQIAFSGGNAANGLLVAILGAVIAILGVAAIAAGSER
jgi:hypothetical protein